MTQEPRSISVEGRDLPVYSMNTLVIGSGAAGLNAALKLYELGQKDLLLVTERLGAGTSYNAGSDKQTYYKLSVAGSMLDSPRQMAEDLFLGGCTHGDTALCEAMYSVQAFYRLAGMGVPFPHDRYGAYVGYRTDHDPRGRATSAGPLTSRFMCECLEQEISKTEITVLDDHPIIALLWARTPGGRRKVCGAVGINRSRVDEKTFGFVLFNAKNVILATGGPGGMYRDSVYPASQFGSTGLALSIGAAAHNVTESQFGLASVGFRWNLSGSYQQVIPRYVSRDNQGGEEHEFLNDHFPDMETLARAIFRKGYEWPFDADKISNFGSSLIDILVFRETVTLGRRVFLDFTRNPKGSGADDDFSIEELPEEARAYLEKSRALLPTPLERLQAMNPEAIEVYRRSGIDLAKDELEIAVCAQHNNGGLKGDLWWESNVRHLFPIGEANGTHGVRRPGGSALNAGQVGGFRAALFIAKRYAGPAPEPEEFLQRTGEQVRHCFTFADAVTGPARKSTFSPAQVIKEIRARMSCFGAQIRDPGKAGKALAEAWELHERLKKDLMTGSIQNLAEAFRAVDLTLTHAVYLEALKEYLERDGKSRGSYLVLDSRGERPCRTLEDSWKFSSAKPDDFVNRKILEIHLDEDFTVKKHWVDIRPIPREDEWFENVWSDFAQDRVIRREERDD